MVFCVEGQVLTAENKSGYYFDDVFVRCTRYCKLLWVFFRHCPTKYEYQVKQSESKSGFHMLCSKDEQEFIDNEKDNQDGAAVKMSAATHRWGRSSHNFHLDSHNPPHRIQE